ncbi:MAG TPA: proton-conducting transporter membrane subunit [Gemmatimonadaceae bacterium]|nr:proton-conducting transporter membrane subunit [Gemmatimonadaceae bacterium]
MNASFLVDGAAVWPVLVPLAAAAITLLLRYHETVQRSVMEAAVLLMLASSVLLLGRVISFDTVSVAFGGWGAPFGITFVADRLGALGSVAVGIAALAVAVFARADIRSRRRRAGFDPMFLAMLAAVNGAFLTGDLFNLYVWFELMLIAAVGLITLDRRAAQLDGAVRYATLSILGASFILLGIGLLYAETGTLDLVRMASEVAGRPPTVARTAAAFLLLAGFALKTGLFPLFFWLPSSYHTAPTSVSAALAGLLTKVAFYASLRVFVSVFGLVDGIAVPGLATALALVAAATMLVGVLAANAQTDIRRVFAYQVTGQVGYLAAGLSIASLAGIAAAIYYMVHTLLLQTGLFLGEGAIARATGSHDLRRAGGLMRLRPRFAALYAVLLLSLAGVPPFSGFWSKFMVIDAAFRGGSTIIALIALAASFLTLYGMSNLWTQVFWKTPPERKRAVRPIPPAMLAALTILAACTIGMGLFVEPVTRFARHAAAQVTPGTERVPSMPPPAAEAP